MRIHPVSFLLGLGAAAVAPLLTRVLRPLAVEVAAAGMGAFEEGRRLVAEQLETLEDITAEARARRAEVVAAAHNGHFDADHESAENGAPRESAADAPARRRAPAGTRSRAS